MLLLYVNFEKYTSINSVCDTSKSNKTLGCGWSHGAFIEVNFSKLPHNNQIFRNNYVFSHYHLCEFLMHKFYSLLFSPMNSL